MNRKINDNLATVLEAGFLLLIFGLVFVTMAQNPTRLIITVNFCITILLFIYLTVRSNRRIKNAVRRITDEISTLPNNLSEKSYDHIQDETRVFYEELTRVKRMIDQQSRMRQELLDIVNTVATNMEFGKLLRELMPRFNEATRSSCSAFYTVNSSTHKLEIKHSVGFSKNIYSEFDLTLGEGMIGQGALKGEITLYRDIPEDTIYTIRTFLGKIKPRCLMVVPVLTQDNLSGVLVCAGIYDYTREDREMVELIRQYLGVAVNNGVNYEKTKRLTNELTFQNKLIQDQHEEMKKKLNEKTELLNCLVNYIGNDCIYALDQNKTVLVWNKGAERIHGITGHLAIGKKIDRLYEEHHWPPMEAQLQTALKDGAYSECFWRYGPDGVKLKYELAITCIHTEENNPFGVIIRIREAE